MYPPEPGPKPVCHFKIEAVVVCDSYTDFLRHTLPQNKHLFDKIVVVTSHEDRATQRMCEFYHVECVATDVLESRKKKFCKGAGINEGLSKLSKDGWVVHLDADIWLPPTTRVILQRAQLDKKMIYGIDRFIVKGAAAWHKFLDAPILQQEDGTWIHTYAFPIGTRFMQEASGGYVPIGFFQLWSPKETGVDKYPEGHTSAGREDILFPKQWTRAERGFIPEIIGYHLESADAGFGTNWKGRKSAPFTVDEL